MKQLAGLKDSSCRSSSHSTAPVQTQKRFLQLDSFHLTRTLSLLERMDALAAAAGVGPFCDDSQWSFNGQMTPTSRGSTVFLPSALSINFLLSPPDSHGPPQAQKTDSLEKGENPCDVEEAVTTTQPSWSPFAASGIPSPTTSCQANVLRQRPVRSTCSEDSINPHPTADHTHKTYEESEGTTAGPPVAQPTLNFPRMSSFSSSSLPPAFGPLSSQHTADALQSFLRGRPPSLHELQKYQIQNSPYVLGSLLQPVSSSTTTFPSLGQLPGSVMLPGSFQNLLMQQQQQQALKQLWALSQLHPSFQNILQCLAPDVIPHNGVDTFLGVLSALSARSDLDHHVQLQQPATPDRAAQLEAILSRAESRAREDEEAKLRDSTKKRRLGNSDSPASYSSSRDRMKRRRKESNSSSADRCDDENECKSDIQNLKHEHDSKEAAFKRKQATPKQVVLLEQVFAVEPIPGSGTKLRLAEVLNMSPKRVTVWFKNKRARQKKQSAMLSGSPASSTGFLPSVVNPDPIS